ncbi:MAG TPA: hypothetical protein ENI23_10195 [bacterium]|nr:hypothetical protein [bacterium]
MIKPTPKKVTLGSESKHFVLEDGVSNGSSVSVTFDIPKDMPKKELVTWMYSEKERLDLFVLSAEVLKGALSKDLYAVRKAVIKENYDRLLHRQSEEDLPISTETDE